MRQFLQTVRDLWRDPMGRVGMTGIFLLIVVAIIAPVIAPYGPEQMVAMPQLAPCAEYWFGTDNYGRDIFSRIIYGARVSLLVGFAAETENVLENARGKLLSKRLDLIVANDVTAEGAGFGTDTNIVTLISHGGVETLPLMSKREVAHRIWDAALALRSAQPQ